MYGIALNLKILEIINGSSAPLTVRELTDTLNVENYEANSFKYKNLKERVADAARKLAEENFIARERHQTPIKTVYFTYKPIQK